MVNSPFILLPGKYTIAFSGTYRIRSHTEYSSENRLFIIQCTLIKNLNLTIGLLLPWERRSPTYSPPLAESASYSYFHCWWR